MSEYQYYEFLAVDQPLDERQQAEVRALSTRARITATSFANEYHWGDFRGDPSTLMARYYDAHLYYANWGTRRVMLRLPRKILSLEVAERYCVDPYVTASVSQENLVLDLTSEADPDDWSEESESRLDAIIGVRAELAAGDRRPLYLAWLAAYGTWERNEDAFSDDHEDVLEPSVPAGLRTLTGAQRALADFLCVDADLLKVAAQASPPLARPKDDARDLTDWIKNLPDRDKDELLRRVAQGQGAQVQMELMRQFRGGHDGPGNGRRTVAELLDAAAEFRNERERREEAERAAEKARRERALARGKRLDSTSDSNGRRRSASW
ncbi:hypothetical protein Acsp04_50180 [Actinomadura sp. NBRC 104425]|uniref:hypothetical protein n=1 Tax=Actinomadura sp. NBRC 104425 TaxID=3032204 RepID=UPI00249FA039|nr:hypothetical protein [Actinomadura sp. NBRC 104425]GLZ14783.1 hypothetical protein Acsp04_50180 [Actinomadura sp. NBRC 104425]